MDKQYSYTDFLRAVGHSNEVDEAEKLLDEIYLDLFLNHIQRIHRQEQLIALIDVALDNRDKQSFQQYAAELQMLREETTE
ncbi:IDEAL domain-containing protein [Lysinibacillus piscis]|uniref:IDEAL domain-containing protein n=1 Tax=Lysinibacillus piscis TaxID=2518931 RepID=A0ABQ5NHM1_9BACI|nr:IDEAL domain-containing protein [Lysinibacillus sp. KH24]GLC87779.1 hypothetical protein LYSBPC_09060 [Lysinibacillus sp. KH24]